MAGKCDFKMNFPLAGKQKRKKEREKKEGEKSLQKIKKRYSRASERFASNLQNLSYHCRNYI